MMKTAEVNAVEADDTLALLDLLGVGEEFRSGDLRCAVCETPLREAGLGAGRKTGDTDYEFACERLDCLEEFHAA